MALERVQPIRREKAPYELDYSDLLRQAYWNCVISLNSPFTSAVNVEGISMMESKVSTERFVGCVLILDSMIIDKDKDEGFNEALEKVNGKDFEYEDALVLFHEITELFQRKNIYKVIGVPHARIP